MGTSKNLSNENLNAKAKLIPGAAIIDAPLKEIETTEAASGELSDLSRSFVEVMPRAMWAIRSGVRQAAGDSFTMPQFRVLTQLRKRSSTNGELAELMGVSVPAMSRMVDGLVEMGFVVRVPQEHDRRQVKLELNMEGRRKFRRLQKHTHGVFVQRFSSLALVERLELLRGLKVLEELFP